jgi:two-component system sensor histidine kinase/response regulator
VLLRSATTRFLRSTSRSLTLPTMLALAAVLIVVAGMFAALVLTGRALDSTAHAVRRATVTQQEAGRLERTSVDLETGVRGYLITRDRAYLKPYEEGRRDIATRIPRLLRLAKAEPRVDVVEIRDLLVSYVRDYAEPLVRGGGFGSAALLDATREGKRRLDKVRFEFVELHDVQQELTDARFVRAQALRDRMLQLAGAGALVSALLLLLLALGIHRLILVPVRRVAAAAGRVTDGELGARVPDIGHGETRLLASAFNSMAESLAAREEDLRVQTDRLQGILDHTTTSITVKDRDGRYVLCNAEMLRLTGCSAEEVLGATDAELFLPHIATANRATDVEVLRTGEVQELEQETDDRAYHIVTFPLRRADGSAYATATMGTDVSERKRALSAAVEASRSKSEFLANMSHEIRTPLNGVIGMTDLLLESDLTAEQRNHAQTAANSGEALLGVISDILDFSKIEAGKLELDQHDFDLREAVEDVSEMLASQAHAKGLELLAWIDEDVPLTVRGDRGRLCQVLTNLLSNAVKFTERGEVAVCVSVERRTDSDARVRFEVSDTGIGIAQTAIARLFDSFAQADSSTTRRYGGTGLGLAISRQLVELMGGSIGCRSEAGAGSTFDFAVQLVTPAASRGARRARHPLPNALHALVVDDNATNCAIIEAYLHGRNARCESAGSGAEALELMHAAVRAGEPFEVVILDGQMPGMDGIELAKAISQAPTLRAARLVMLTSTVDRMAAARDAGIYSYLTKPVRRMRLLEVVAEAMGTLARAPRPDPEADAEASASPSARPVLVVDDNVVNQHVIEAMLSKRGYTVDCAGNGREGLAMVAAYDYALVFLDCQMPELDGYEATAEIRKREADSGARLTIVAMTAHAMKGDRERCIAAGMDDYLSKPLRPDDLDAVLERWLGAGGAALPAPGHEPEAGLLDEARMRMFREDYAEIADQLVDLFADSTPPLLRELRADAERGDGDAMRRTAHKLRGSCLNIGAIGLAAQAGRVEQGADDPTLLEGLEDTFEATRVALHTALGGAARGVSAA